MPATKAATAATGAAATSASGHETARIEEQREGKREENPETLSPIKMALLLARERHEEDGLSDVRRATMSSEALEAMVASIEVETDTRNEQTSETMHEARDTSRERRPSTERDVSPATSMPTTVDSVPRGDDTTIQRMAASSGETGSGRATLDPQGAASIMHALRKEAASIKRTSSVAYDAHKEVMAKMTTKKRRRRKSSSPVHVLTRTRSSMRLATHRHSLSTVYETETTQTRAQDVDMAAGQATIDSHDAVLLVTESLTFKHHQATRRETELTTAATAEATGSREHSDDASPQPCKQASNGHEEGVEERERRPDHAETNAAMAVDAELTPQSPSNEESKRLEDDRGPTSLVSPPLRVRTPLKSILSAHKSRRTHASDAMQTTPTKSVNFGPSQGAEFHHGSPSTSMTPMLAKDASRLFPSEPQASSEDEPDDAETSMNSSILDEVDAQLDDDDDDGVNSRALQPRKVAKPRFSLLDARTSLLSSKSIDPSRRRQTFRGFSPLDSQSQARKRRRQSSRPRARFTAPSSGAPQRTEALETTGRRPYVDSSASSDAGEDMEISGEYCFMLGRESDLGRRDDDTTELSLGKLLAEASVYELTKSAPDVFADDLPGSLTDLANEVASFETDKGSQSLETTMVRPSPEDGSRMSLESEGEATTELDVQINLETKFDQVCTPPAASPVLSMAELVVSVEMDASLVSVETKESLLEDWTTWSDVQLACVVAACTDVITGQLDDVSTWSAALDKDLTSLLELAAPSVFTVEDTGRALVPELYAVEAVVARTGWCQLQTQVEKHVTTRILEQAQAVAQDARALTEQLEAAQRECAKQVAAIKEQIEREAQVAELLDAIEEQQGIYDEYATAVDVLEKECATLTLQDSVLQSRLNALEAQAAELEPVTPARAATWADQVLESEEKLAIQEQWSIWTIEEATASVLRLVASFQDVYVRVDVCVTLEVSVLERASIVIETKERLRSEADAALDVMLELQRLVLHAPSLARVVDTDASTAARVQCLEHVVHRAFRFLHDVRHLSTLFALRYERDEQRLWVDFVASTFVRPRLSVGFALGPAFPYTDSEVAVTVFKGEVASTAVRDEIERVSRDTPHYVVQVCQRVYDGFVR